MVAEASDDYMIDEVNPHESPGGREPRSESDIVLGWGRITRRMVVCD
jgi:hypothetical protein